MSELIRTVSKQISFCYGHRLVGYPHKCRHVHGHNCVAEITLALREGASLDAYGFVEDFNEFKVIKDWIDENWDHAFLASPEDKSMIEFLKADEQRYYVMQDNPTAENMATEIGMIAKEKLENERVSLVGINIWETPTSKCRVIFDDCEEQK